MRLARTAQEWIDVKAEGTFVNGNDICSVWEYNNELWKCNFIDLSEHERHEVLEACNVAEGGTI